MKLIRIALSILFVATVASIGTSLTVSPSVFADINSDAQAYCNGKYPTYTPNSQDSREEQQNKRTTVQTNRVGCVRGYVHGDGRGEVCQNLVRDSVVSRQNEPRAKVACIDGYNAKVAAQPAAPPGNPAPPAGPDNNPSASANLKLGPPPTTGSIDSVETPPDQHTERSVCGIEGFFGELVCGLTIFASKITDASFYMLKIFLEVEPFSTIDEAGNETATYTAWSLFRGVANGFFVIAFLMVIYSHLTSAGISNYNVKRMIPRLIIAALLVNLSFYLSSLLVDLSNIVGITLVDLMRGVADTAVNETGVPVKPANNSFEQAAGSVLLIGAGAAAAGAAVLYAGLPVLLPILASGFVALVTTVLALMLRQVLIIVFIILSPLAFVSILLPNTSQFFDKWKSVFIPILMVFPAISLLYGAGYLASISIQRTAAANGDTILQIMSLGVMVMPLFMVPAVMKLGGGLLNRFGGITNTPGAALRKKAESRAEKMSKKRDFKALNYDPSKDKSNRLTKGLRGARAKARTNRMARAAKDDRIAQTRDIAGTAQLRSAIDDDAPTLVNRLGFTDTTKGEALQQAMAQSKDREEMGRARNHVLHEKIKAHARDVEAKAIAEREADDGSDPESTRNQLMAKALANMNSEANTVTALEKEAAILQLARSGDMGALLGLVKGSYTMNEQQRQTLVNTIRSSGAGAKSLPFLANQESLDNIMQGKVNEANFGSTVIAPSLAQDDYSGATYADMDQDAAAEIANVVANQFENNDTSVISKEVSELHQQAAHAALNNSDTSSRVAASRKHLDRMAMKITHEEALVQNQLHDMNNRPEEPW